MKDFKLMSMVDFVEYDEIDYHDFLFEESQKLSLIRNYAAFLKQPLTLGMFVPCREDGIPIEISEFQNPFEVFDDFVHAEYLEAQSRVLFEGFKAKKCHDYYLVVNDKDLPVWASWNDSKTVEDIVYEHHILTETALKQIGL